MKKFLFIGCLFLAPKLYAQQGVQDVHEVAKSTNTITQTINVCNSVIDVALTTSSGTLAGSFATEVYTLAAATNTINCGFDVSLSTQQYSVWYGREVPAGVGVLWQTPSWRKVYCMSQNSGGCTRASITQFK